MVEPVSLLIIAAVGLLGGTATAAAVSYLTLPQVKAWFQARRYALLSNDAVAVTVTDLLAAGDYRTVQGVLDTRTRTWTDYRVVEGRLSPELSALHRNRRVVYHTV
jgi:hypothetical protein